MKKYKWIPIIMTMCKAIPVLFNHIKELYVFTKEVYEEQNYNNLQMLREQGERIKEENDKHINAQQSK